MLQSLSGQGEIECAQIGSQLRASVSGKVSLSVFGVWIAGFIHILSVIHLPCAIGAVCPCRVEMQAEKGAVSPMLPVGDSREKFLKIVETPCPSCVIITPAPTASIEPRIRRVHHSMQHHRVAMLVFHLSAIHMQRRQTSNADLCHRCQTSQPQRCSQNKCSYFHFFSILNNV